jgi:protein-tyrosine kinase
MSIIERAAKRMEERKEPLVASVGPVLQDGFPVAYPHGDRGLPESEPSKPAAKRTAVTRVEIDLFKLGHRGFITPDSSSTLVAEEFRVIKRPLIRNAMGRSAGAVRNGNLIMVTSALPGEGKSTTSLNLAMSIAMEVDNTVLLVDADVARPSLPETLGVEARPGLLDVLGGKIDLAEALLPTNVSKFAILHAGTPHPKATEMLASDSMRQMLDEMANRYSDRLIVFDSPPLLLSNESRVLASHMGQIVVVVEAESTMHGTLLEALATIESCPVKLLLLNKAKAYGGGAYGTYGTYGGSPYGYGQGR